MAYKGAPVMIVIVLSSVALANVISSVPTKQYILRPSQGLALAPETSIRVIQGVERIKVVYAFLPEVLEQKIYLCNETIDPYGPVIREGLSVLNQTRKKRFVDILGLFAGLAGTGLGLKNMLDIHVLQKDLERVAHHQAIIDSQIMYLRNSFRVMKEAMSKVVEIWSRFQRMILHVTASTKCLTLFVLDNFSIINDNIQLLRNEINALTKILRGHISPDEIKVLVRPEMIREVIKGHQSALPADDDLYQLVEVIPGQVSWVHRTFSFVLLVPLFAVDHVEYLEILNTGFLSRRGEYRRCEINGRLAYDNEHFYQVHGHYCKQGRHDVYCPQHALVKDDRILARESDLLCPKVDGVKLPAIMFEEGLMLITTSETVVATYTGSTGILKSKQLTSSNGCHVVPLHNVTSVRVANRIVYRTFNIRTASAMRNFSIPEMIVLTNVTGFPSFDDLEAEPTFTPYVDMGTHIYSISPLYVIVVCCVIMLGMMIYCNCQRHRKSRA